MSWCRTRRSTSPTETSPSTSAHRSSPATTSRPRSPLPSVASSTSRRAVEEGFDEIIVRVGPGKGRKVRFVGVFLGEWVTTSPSRVETFRVYRGRTGKFVLHIERSPDYPMVDAEGKPAGWRAHLGLDWNVSYGNEAGRVDPRGRRRRSTSSVPADPRTALRHRGDVRPAACRGRPRHLTFVATPTLGEVRHDRDRAPGRRSTSPGCASHSGSSSSSTASISTSRKGRSSPSSDPTAPARRPWSGSSRR